MESMKIRRLLLFCCIGLCLPAENIEAQQSRSELERRKKLSLRRISTAKRILSQTDHTKKASINQLTLLSKRIEAQATLVATISQELYHINGVISGTHQFVQSLQADLKKLQAEYVRMVLWAYKDRSGINQLTFLFSSDSFRQLFLRMKYLTHYARQRRVQLEAIQKVHQALDHQQRALHKKRRNQETLFKEERLRRRQLLKLKKEKQQLIRTLSTRSAQLRKELKVQRASIARLDKLIKTLIAKDTKSATALDQAAQRVLSRNFLSKKKRLDWPVPIGIIASKFGLQQHPVFKNIKQKNIGIEIQTPGSVAVRSVFEGVVSEIALIPGMNSVVIIQHGAYRTVYARLKKILVNKGEYLASQQQIGQVYTNAQGHAAVHFEVWHNTETLNPERWLRSQR